MKKLSLVGLKAISVVVQLANDGAFYISSYNQPIGMVVSLASTKREFYTLMEALAERVYPNEDDET